MKNITKKYIKNFSFLDDMCIRLENETKRSLDELEHIDRIAFRVKNTESFVDKIQRKNEKNEEYKNPLKEMEDQIGGRVIVFFTGDINIVKNKLECTFGAVESFHKHPENDKEFDYESYHYVFIIPEQFKNDDWLKNNNLPNTFELLV